MANRKRIGIILPSVNNVFEPDIQRLAPADVTFHTARMPISNATVDSLKQMNEAIEDCARSLATAGVDVMAYACTSGSFFGGPGYDQQVIQRIQEAGGTPAVATSAAVVEALRALNIKKVCVATPYPDEVNAKIPPFLEGNGFQVVNMVGRGLGAKSALDIGDDPPEQIYDFALAHWNPEADGVFLSCTDWQALAVVERLEQAIGKPVVTANQATIWTTFQKLGYTEPIQGYGRLFRTSAAVSEPAR